MDRTLLYPESFDSAGIPKPATMRIARQGNETVLRGTMTAYWPASGNLLPLYAFYFADGSSYVAIDERNSIQVLPPPSHLQNNKQLVSLVLTYALFFLTLLGIVTTVIELVSTPESPRSPHIDDKTDQAENRQSQAMQPATSLQREETRGIFVLGVIATLWAVLNTRMT